MLKKIVLLIVIIIVSLSIFTSNKVWAKEQVVEEFDINNSIIDKEQKQEIEYIDTITLNKFEIEILPGGSYLLEPTMIDEYKIDNNQSFNWISSNEEIATVDSYGIVTGVSEGEVIIVAMSEDGINHGYCRVNVVLESDNIFVEYISIDEKIKVIKGKTKIINSSIKPSEATVRELVWKSDNEDIAVVDKLGNVTGINEGNTKIIAISEEGIKYAICQVNVELEDIMVEKIIIDDIDRELTIGDSIKINTSVIPENATNKKLVWESSDTNVITISEYGIAEVKGYGSAVIKVSSEDGDVYTNLLINIIESSKEEVNEGEDEDKDKEVKIKEIKLNKSDVEMVIGDVMILEALIGPEEAKDEKILWESDNEEFAKVDSSGKIVALKQGEVIISVFNENKDISAKCKIKIIEKSNKKYSETEKDKNSQETDNLPQTGNGNFVEIYGIVMIIAGWILARRKV